MILDYLCLLNNKKISEFMRFLQSHLKGFTIIELVVVIAIIAVLSGIIISNINEYQAKARDAKRISDLDNIRKALEMYRVANGFYPPVACGYDCNGYYFSSNANWQILENYLKPYISPLPKDPINNTDGPWTAGNYSYAYGNVGRYTNSPQYDLAAELETPNHPLSCKNKCTKYYFNTINWCRACGGGYTNQIYEASPN